MLRTVLRWRPTTGGETLVYTSGGGTLEGVTMDAYMDLTAMSARVAATGGLTLNGKATMGSNASLLFSGAGESFTIMSFGSSSGSFAAIDGSSIGGGKHFEPTTGASALTLDVVAD